MDVSLLRWIFWVSVAISAYGCGDGPTEPPLSGQRSWPSVDRWVSGVAAASLDAEGHFVFPVPDTVSSETVLHPASALRLMNAFVNTFIKNEGVVGNLRQSLRAQHGQAITWEDLEPISNSPFFARTPYVVPSDVAIEIRNAFAPEYIAIYQQRERVATIAIALAATATYLQVDADGWLTGLAANEFTVDGISMIGDLPVPMTAEHAVEAVARRVDAKVAEVPEYILPRSLLVPWAGYWRVVFDQDVPVRNFDRGLLSVDTLYVKADLTADGGWSARFYVPTPKQPASVLVEYPGWDQTSQEYQMVQDTFGVDPEVPVWYEEVIP